MVTRSDLPPLENYINYLKKIWTSRQLTNNGEFVQLLERKLEKYLKVKNLLLVANGTLALQLALKSFHHKGEVITTPFTFATTTNVIVWEGLTPVFSDIDSETFNIDPNDVERKITDKTVAILAVHIFGNPCYVEQLQEIADKHNLELIYDAAHAFGVEYKNQSVLNFGKISAMSFHATKVFNTAEGGALVINDDELYKKMMPLRDHGFKFENEVVVPGLNAKMNEFQASLGLCNLEYIDEKIRLRRMIYEYYKKKLSGMNVKFQKITASNYNFIYMPVCFENIEKRDRIYLELTKNGIKTKKYFCPLTVDFNYFKEENKNFGEKFNLKNAHDISNRVLCLPIYPDLETSSIDEIINIIKDIYYPR